MNNKGFSMIEAITSFSIFMMMMLTLMPIVYQLKTEDMVLSQRREIPSVLHDELQQYIWKEPPSLPIENTKKMTHTLVTFRYEKKNGILKGCASWTNEKQKNENFCLYGYPQ